MVRDRLIGGQVRKIFISYRRGDSATSAIGIAQYLEREFGRGTVFIDIDMKAGVNFPAVLEKCLVECKVLLALIGPSWLNPNDGEGRRRLDDPNDWVRLEIARALTRNITVIPVRINGTELPKKADLPEDMRGLVDHQAAIVRTEDFRNGMAGLARDIRAVPEPWPWRHFRALAAAALVFLVGGWAVLSRLDWPIFRRLVAVQVGNDTGRASPPANDNAPTLLRGSISFRSEPGDYIGQGKSWDVTNADGHITATVAKNSVTINFHGDASWNLDFVAPEGKRIETGDYTGATRAPFNSPTKPGLSVSGDGRGCNTLTGRFHVRQIAYAKSGDGIEQFAADFEQHCEGQKPALSGSVEVSAVRG